jgi:transcriptional regulator with XRE-family HTH domain
MGDDLAMRVFKLRAEGQTQAQISKRVGVSRSTVSRILAAGAPVGDEDGPRLQEVEAIARAMGEVDEASRARLGLARSLAAKLDQCREQRTAASAVAAANLARQYRETLDELQPLATDDMQLLMDVLMKIDDGAEERYRTALNMIASRRSDGSPEYRAPRFTAEEAHTIAYEALTPSK